METEDLLNSSLFSFAFLPALKGKFADVFFLVDSGLTSAELLQVRTILARLVNQLKFSASTNRLALAQYGQDVKMEFLFKTLKTKEELLNAIKRFRLRKQPNEAHNLGAALRYAHANVFTAEAGSRADQSQYLVIVSGKDSDDSIYQEVRLLKSARIQVMSYSLAGPTMALSGPAVGPAPPQYSFQSLNSAVPNLKMMLEKEEVMDVTDGENL